MELQTNRNPFSLVVGFDFSDEAHLALDHAFAMAADRAPSFIHVLAVLETGLGSSPDHEEAMRVHDRVAKLAENMRRARGLETVTLLAHARIGSPATSITELAREVDAEMVVVGTHGRTGAERWLLGSVAERVVRTAPCPVMVVRPREHPAHVAPHPPAPQCDACVTVRRNTGGASWWCDEHRGDQLEPHVFPPPPGPEMHPVRGVAETKPTAPFGLKPSALERAGRS